VLRDPSMEITVGTHIHHTGSGSDKKGAAKKGRTDTNNFSITTTGVGLVSIEH